MNIVNTKNKQRWRSVPERPARPGRTREEAAVSTERNRSLTMAARIDPPFCYALLLFGALVVAAGCHTPSRGVAPATDVPASAGGSLHPKVKVETTLGDFVLELDAEKAPITVMNFVDYVRDKFYNGTIFHRVVSNSMIQGGAYTSEMDGKVEGLRPAIENEWPTGLKNLRGTIGMVRQPGVTHSARAEFYINVVDNFDLEHTRDGAGYAVFGRVVDGFDTIERTRDTPVGTHEKYAMGRSAVVPIMPVIIRSVRLISPLDRVGAEAVAEANRAARENRVQNLIKKLEAQAGREAVTTASGLVYVDLRIGDGAAPIVVDKVDVYYRGTFIDGREFEGSLEEPVTIELNTAIEGWQEGLMTMREGGKRVLIIPPELAYGPDGVPRKIPPDSTLVFEIELLEIK